MPLLWISIAFIAGAVVPLFWSITILAFTIAGVVFFITCFFEKRLLGRFQAYLRLRKILPVPVCLMIAAFLGGVVRGEAGRPAFNPDDLAYYNGNGRITILAVASQPVENHDKSTLLTVTARLMKVDDAPVSVSGDAIVLLPAGSRYAYGDLLEITGNLQTPPEREDFSYKQYLENKGVFSYLAYPRIHVVGNNAGNPILAIIYDIRDWIAVTVEQIIPQPEAAFLSGMLVGRDEDISDSLKKAFQDTGTSHLVAISGFNITIVAGLILALTGRLLSKRWSVWAAIIILGCYAVMAGASPSVVRAAIMGALAMISRSIGRNRTAVNSLGLAAASMVLFNPLILRDIGFQLSVAATAGILLIGVPVNEWLIYRKTSPDKPAEINYFWRTVGDSMVITIAAQLATFPFLMFHFHRYPLIGLLVNPCVLPVQPAAMILGGLAALAGIIWLPLGNVIGCLAWIPLVYTTRIVEWFSNFRGLGLINLHMDLWLAALFTVALILAVIFRKAWMTGLQNISRYLLAGLSIALMVLLVNALFMHPDGRLHVQVFRQGSDLSSYIVTPGGQHILVTNRPGDKDLVAFVDRRLPILQKSLDAVIIPNATSSTSISMGDNLSSFQPEWLLINEQAGGTKTQSKLTAELIEGDLGSAPLETGQRFDLGRGAELSIRAVDAKGSRMRVTWGSQRVDLLYGSSTEINAGDSDTPGRMDVVILDHPADNVKIHETRLVLDAKNLTFSTGSQVTVEDGAWLEIRSDGDTSILLEKANDAS